MEKDGAAQPCRVQGASAADIQGRVLDLVQPKEVFLALRPQLRAQNDGLATHICTSQADSVYPQNLLNLPPHPYPHSPWPRPCHFLPGLGP